MGSTNAWQRGICPSEANLSGVFDQKPTSGRAGFIVGSLLVSHKQVLIAVDEDGQPTHENNRPN